MNYTQYLKHRFGTKGLFVTYAIELIVAVLLFQGYLLGNMEPMERRLLAITFALFVGYQVYVYVRFAGKIDDSLFDTYPITTIHTIADHMQSKGVKSMFIGKLTLMEKEPDWRHIAHHLKMALRLSHSFDPDIPHHLLRTNRTDTLFFPADYLWGVKYADGLYQFVQLRLASQDLHQAMQYITPYKESGGNVVGDYERLKDTPEQFTPKRWAVMWLAITIVTMGIIIASLIMVS